MKPKRRKPKTPHKHPKHYCLMMQKNWNSLQRGQDEEAVSLGHGPQSNSANA